MIHPKDCSAEALFGVDCAELLKVEPYGYAINRGGPGPGGLDTKSPYWALADDPLRIPNCKMILTKFVDGSPIALRYQNRDIVPDRRQ